MALLFATSFFSCIIRAQFLTLEKTLSDTRTIVHTSTAVLAMRAQLASTALLAMRSQLQEAVWPMADPL